MQENNCVYRRPVTEAERLWDAYLLTFPENSIRVFCKGDIIEYQGQKYRYDGNHGLISLEDTDQTAKADAGKPRLSLVPTEIINCIARVREYDVAKYTDPGNWKRVSADRYHDALFRHVIAYINDPTSVDEESGLPHLWHIAANCAFLCELEKKK